MDGEEPPRSGEEGSRVLLFDYSVENHLKAMNSIADLLFDYSVENHLKAMNSIADLCGETGTDFDENEINRLSSSITFLREWRHFNYEPRTIRFYEESNNIPEPKDIVLPQFSSASVQKGKIHGESPSAESSKDFVMYVGGSVWALDWCPRVHKNPDAQAKCEFLAVAAHPPESYTHKIGVPLTGRGIIQIWCILNLICEKGTVLVPEQNQKRKSQPGTSTAGKPRGRPRKESPDESLETAEAKRPRGRPRKNPIETVEPRKPRGRPRKHAIGDIPGKLDGDVQYIQALAVQYPGQSVVPLAIEAPPNTSPEISVSENKVKSDDSGKVASSGNSNTKLPIRRKRCKTGGAEEGFRPTLSDINEEGSHHSTEEELMVVSNVQDRHSLDISKDTTLPRVVLCLAHNGKVAWDMKWRPLSTKDSQSKHIMGYLAVLLGNGSLEVWEVPMPQVTAAIYLSSSKPDTDPRFVKLAPIFRCSKLKCGDAQSIPLTVEWSTSGNPDFLLAGCHDGSVAIWKFSTTKSSEDTRPLLFFSADTAPIRSVAWAPGESDRESANIIATAGHGGVKFWDIRDPFRPLWDLHPVPRFIYSLNWLSDPRCVLLSFDDGAIRIISLMKAAYDVAATGKPFPGTKQQGLSVYNCSSSPIWNVQVSPLTGIAAYCSADGAVLHFQLTAKAVEKDSRYRTPHFLCGYLTMENSVLTVHTPLPDNPITLKKPVKESGESSKCLRSLLNESNKRASFPLADVQPLALAFPEDPNSETESEGTTSTSSHASNKAPKTKNRATEDKDKRALVCVDEGRANAESSGTKEERGGDEAEGFPPRMVAMHRVRWNANRGSERWLCYGGAAGIVRCQELALPLKTKR